MLRSLFGKVFAKAKYAFLAGVAVFAMSLSPSEANAQWGISFGNYGGYGGYSGYRGHNHTTYHAPSVHYHKQFHGYSHWTPSRGYHSHGHYDYVPHYVPGHVHNRHHH